MKMKKGDKIIFVILLIALGAFGVNYFIFQKTENKVVIVEIDGEIYTEVSLTDGGEEKKQIPLKNGEVFSLILDREGAWVEDVNCPDKVCIKTGKVSDPGKTIVCLPNKFVVYIKDGGKKEKVKVDGVAF